MDSFAESEGGKINADGEVQLELRFLINLK
jgi:hypothetical protein